MRELLQQALDALESVYSRKPLRDLDETICALRSALAAPMPEPVAWPALVAETVLDTPEPDKWVDIGEVRPLPMFHMHTLMRYGERCAESGITHGVKTASPAAPAPVVPNDAALNALARLFHNGEEIESDDGAAMAVDLSLWHEAAEAFDSLIGEGDGETLASSAAPVVREPLTDEQIDALQEQCTAPEWRDDTADGWHMGMNFRKFARDVLAAHGIGGGGNG